MTSELRVVLVEIKRELEKLNKNIVDKDIGHCHECCEED